MPSIFETIKGGFRKAVRGARAVGEKVMRGTKAIGERVVGRAKAVGEKVISVGKDVIQAVRGKQTSGMSPSAKLMAKFANEAYKSSRTPNISGYDYQPEDSDSKRAVYISHGGKRIVMAERGTKIDDSADLRDDLLIVLGHEATIPRVRTELRKLSELSNRYPGYQFELAGHSLGGAIVLEMIAQADSEQYAKIREGSIYNPGIAKVEVNPRWKAKIFNYHIISPPDPISILSTAYKFNQNNGYMMSADNPHTIENFL